MKHSSLLSSTLLIFILIATLCTISSIAQQLDKEHPSDDDSYGVHQEVENNENQQEDNSGAGAGGRLRGGTFDADNLEHTTSVADGLSSSFMMIIVSEMGDETFIIAAIMAVSASTICVFD